MMRFDDPTLEVLAAAREVDIETVRPDDRRRRTTVWVVVDEGEVFVRSWLGDRAHWFQAAIDRPAEVALLAHGHRLPVRAVPASDEALAARCSRGFERKYAGLTSTPVSEMLRPEILGTTLRLEPRAAP